MNKLYEILVPTIHTDSGNPIKVRFHRVWDKKVREITGGLTIMPPSINGEWIAPDGELFRERMIPVRICTTEDKMRLIAEHSAKYYDQQAVMYYVISENVTIYSRAEERVDIPQVISDEDLAEIDKEVRAYEDAGRWLDRNYP